jgi:DNA-binding CsgD family transcriptional regulator/8-oxo-dGTP pyrophosphatase MutT (NUDIX family)
VPNPELPVEPRDAATVVVVRNTARAVEIFCVERHQNSAFMGGAVVFPGGKVDPSDHAEVWRDRSTPLADADRGSHLDVLDSVRAGAVGYLDKDVGSACLPRALRAALAGEPLIPRRLVQDLVREIRLRPARQTVADWAPVSLTRREFDVLDLMRAGLSTAAIAERLFVSPGTVRSHVMSMKRKLHAEDRAALVRCGGGGIPGRAAAR